MADGAKASLPANARRIPVPAAALGPWLAEIDDPTELKATLRAVALLAEGTHRRGVPPSVSLYDLLDDPFLAQGCAGGTVRRGLAAALNRGTLLAARHRGEVCLFLNDDAGRRHLERAALRPLPPSDVLDGLAESAPIQQMPQTQSDAGRANIFSLYEKHIGPYGHSIAEQLKAAEEEYPASWIEYAFSIASEHNARSWSYVNTILRRLVREGLPDGAVVANEYGKFRNDSETNRREAVLEQYRRLFGRPGWESREGDPNGS